jgi:hypothetical protein
VRSVRCPEKPVVVDATNLKIRLIRDEQERDEELKNAIRELETAIGTSTSVPNDWRIKEQAIWNMAIPDQSSTDTNEFAVAAPAVIISALVKFGIKLIVEQIDKALQREIEKYTAVHQVKSDVQLYKKNQVLKYPLLQLTRYDDNDVIALDLLVQMIVCGDDSGDQVLKIRPLRLFLGEAAPKHNGTLGIAVSLKADAVWKGQTLKNALDIENLLLRSMAIGEGQLPMYDCDTYWNVDEEADKQILDRVPFQLLPPSNHGEQKLSMTIVVVEVGNVPWFKQKIAELFHSKTDSISDGIFSLLKNSVAALA